MKGTPGLRTPEPPTSWGPANRCPDDLTRPNPAPVCSRPPVLCSRGWGSVARALFVLLGQGWVKDSFSPRKGGSEEVDTKRKGENTNTCLKRKCRFHRLFLVTQKELSCHLGMGVAIESCTWLANQRCLLVAHLPNAKGNPCGAPEVRRGAHPPPGGHPADTGGRGEAGGAAETRPDGEWAPPGEGHTTSPFLNYLRAVGLRQLQAPRSPLPALPACWLLTHPDPVLGSGCSPGTPAPLKPPPCMPSLHVSWGAGAHGGGVAEPRPGATHRRSAAAPWPCAGLGFLDHLLMGRWFRGGLSGPGPFPLPSPHCCGL